MASHRTRRFRMVGLVLLALALLGGWWWFSRPKPLRLVALIPGEMPFPYVHTPAGFLTANGNGAETHVTFRDWRGAARWAVAVPAKRFPAVTPDPTGRTFWGVYGLCWSLTTDRALSPDGRGFAAVVPDGYTVRFLAWRDGKPTQSFAMSVDEGFYGIRALRQLAIACADDGTLYAIIPDDSDYQVLVIRGSRIAARGRAAYHGPFASTGGNLSCTLVPERHLLLFHDNGGPVGEKVQWSMAGSRVRFPSWCTLRADGSGAEVVMVDPGGRRYRQRDGALLPKSSPLPRALAGQVVGESLHPDYVLAGKQSKVPEGVRTVLAHCGLSWLMNRVEERTTLSVYERAGRCRARLSGRDDNSETVGRLLVRPDQPPGWETMPALNSCDKLWLDAWNALLAPDGHTLVVPCQYTGAADEAISTAILRW